MDSVLGFAMMTLWVTGVVRLFMAQHTGMGWVAMFVPFVFIAGFVMDPKPGSSLYVRQSAERQRKADLRWPVEAAAYHQAVDYMKSEAERRREVIEAKARMEIDRDIPRAQP